MSEPSTDIRTDLERKLILFAAMELTRDITALDAVEKIRHLADEIAETLTRGASEDLDQIRDLVAHRLFPSPVEAVRFLADSERGWNDERDALRREIEGLRSNQKTLGLVYDLLRTLPDLAPMTADSAVRELITDRKELTDDKRELQDLVQKMTDELREGTYRDSLGERLGNHLRKYKGLPRRFEHVPAYDCSRLRANDGRVYEKFQASWSTGPTQWVSGPNFALVYSHADFIREKMPFVEVLGGEPSV